MSEHEVELTSGLAARIAADPRMKTQGCPRHSGFMEAPHATCTCYGPEIVADLRARLADAEARAEAAVDLRQRVELKVRNCRRLSATALDPDVREWTDAFAKDLQAMLDATDAARGDQ